MKRFFYIFGFFGAAIIIITMIYFFAEHNVFPEYTSTQHEEVMETHSNLKKNIVFPDSSVASSKNEQNTRSFFIASSTANNKTKRNDYKKTDSSSSIQENSFIEMDIASLTSFIMDQQTAEDNRTQALGVLLNRIQKENNRNKAIEILINVKDAIGGEGQQSVLKVLSQYSDLGANEAIAETFFNSAYTTSDLERCRMLSYLDPQYSLDEFMTDRFTDAYLQSHDQELKRMLLETSATTCGEEGVYWIIDQTSMQSDSNEMSMLIDALSRSNSELAFNHLHQLINIAEDAESKEHIRRAIFQLKKQRIDE